MIDNLIAAAGVFGAVFAIVAAAQLGLFGLRFATFLVEELRAMPAPRGPGRPARGVAHRRRRPTPRAAPAQAIARPSPALAQAAG